jgi:hypothetical protein
MPIYIGGPKGGKGGRNVGKPWVPQDVKRRRRDVENMMRRMGTPMLHKPRYNDLDFQKGIVEKSPVYDSVYEQTRANDPFSHGVGFVSKEKSDNEWYNSEGVIVKSVTSPGAGWQKAPKHRGYGPSTLTYIIQPDRAEDYYKATPGGPIFKVMDAMAIAPWWPDIDDNDILINVELDAQGNVIGTNERFEAKNVGPVSMHGAGDRRGRRELGPNAVGQFPNTFLMNQTFEMVLIPHTDQAYQAETDR